MANGKPGRPRGENYEKNLQKRLRAAQRQGTSHAQRAASDISDFRQSKMFDLAKSLFVGATAGRESNQDKKPVFNYHEQALINKGIRLRSPDRARFEDLRRLAYGNTLVGAIHKIRIDDLGQFGRPFRDKEGFDFEFEEEKEEQSEEDKALIRKARKWFEYMGDQVEGWQNRDRFHSVFQFMIRDTLAIDSTCFWLIKNGRGQVTEVRYLDPATIFPTTRDGYLGERSIAHVQIVENAVTETFTADELIVRHQNELSDVRYRGTGLSPAEVSIMEIISIMNALKFNRDRFTNNPPPGFLYVPGAMPQDVLDDLQVQWENMFSNNQNNHRFPILTADAPDLKWTSLNSMTEMAFEKLMQWVTTFTLAAHGMDQAELGLRLMGSQTFSEGSMDGRINSAMTRAKKALLSYFSDVCNDIKETVDQFNPTLFTFKGVEVDDEDKKLDRDQKLVKSIEFQDEVRVRRGMPTMGESLAKIYNLPPEDAEKVKFAGAFVLEPTWNQTGAQIVSQVSGGDGAQGGEQTDLFDDYSPDEEDTQENWDS